MKSNKGTGRLHGPTMVLTLVASLGMACSEGGKGGEGGQRRSSMSAHTDPENPPAPPGDRGGTLSTSSTPKTPSRVSPEDAAHSQELLRQAQAAFLSNQLTRAIELAEESVRLRPTTRAWAVLGSAACKARIAGKAKLAFQNLRGGPRHILAQLCRNEGIALP